MKQSILIKLVLLAFLSASAYQISAFAEGPANGGGGYSCEVGSGKRVLLDLIESSPNFIDNYELAKPLQLTLEDSKPFAFYLINNSFDKKLNPLRDVFGKIVELIKSNVSLGIGKLMEKSYDKINRELRLVDNKVYGAEDYKITDKSICVNPAPIAYFDATFGLSLDIKIWNQLGVKSMLGALEHEVLRHLQSQLKGHINLTTSQIQTAVAETLIYMNLNKKNFSLSTITNAKTLESVKTSKVWNNPKIFLTLNEEVQVLEKLFKAVETICNTDEKKLINPEFHRFSTNDKCNNEVKYFIRGTNLIGKEEMCNANSYIKSKRELNESAKIPMDYYPLQEKFRLIQRSLDDLEHYYYYRIPEKCGKESANIISSINNAKWNYLSDYFLDFNKAKESFPQNLDNLDEYPKNLSERDYVFLVIERFIMVNNLMKDNPPNAHDALFGDFPYSYSVAIISGLYYQDKDLHFTEPDSVNKSSQLINEFTESIKQDMEQEKEIYPSEHSKSLAYQIFQSLNFGKTGAGWSVMKKAKEIEYFNLIKQYYYFNFRGGYNYKKLMNPILSNPELNRKFDEILNFKK